jgi:hypothetical protein
MTRSENLAKLRAALDAVYTALEPLYPRTSPKLAVVSYFYPGATWDAMGAPAVAIINPYNGPGASPSSAYTAQIAKTRALGTKVVCYVYTKYGTRPLADVKADITKAKSYYPDLDGMFVDEVSNDPAQLAYYTAVDDHVTATFGARALTILNPGTRSPDATFAHADIVMSFEGTPASYRARPAVVEPEGKAWHCVHSCTEAELPEMIRLATERGAAYLYVCGDHYSALPTFYSQLVGALR